MGLAKKLMMEAEERGWRSAGEKWVCADCFVNAEVKEYILENLSYTTCSYCHNSSSEPMACPIDDVINFIVECIGNEYSTPENELPYESREGGWQGTTIDTWDLLDELNLVDDHSQLFYDIFYAISSQIAVWCRKDYFGMRENELERFSWERFKSLVMYQCRFVFLRMDREPIDDNDHWEELINPLGILDYIGKLLKKYRLIKTLHAGTKLYRVRLDLEKDFNGIKELGPPPVQSAICPNRMSPAGISFFYASSDCDTAVAETWDGHGDAHCSVATFTTLCDCRIVSLIDLPEVPSLVQKERMQEKEELLFLWAFTKDMSTPIKKSDRAHIDYTPTQVVAEYIRHIVRGEAGDAMQGIEYWSSKTRKRTFVFFWGHPDDVYKNKETIGKWCELKDVQHWILKPSS